MNEKIKNSEFGIRKWETRIIKRDIISRNEGIQLPNDEVKEDIENGQGYKYLGILETNGFRNMEMKEKVRKFIFWRVQLFEAPKKIIMGFTSTSS